MNHAPAPPRVLGAVLAGGKSRRFGSDKALAKLDGVALLDHAITGLSRHAETIIICGRTWPGYQSLDDRPAMGLGPLGGLNAALHHAVSNDYDGVLTTGCDMPYFPHDIVADLIGGTAATVAGHHTIGYWPSALASLLDSHLMHGMDRSIRGWIARAGARIIAAPHALANVNTPQNLSDLQGRR